MPGIVSRILHKEARGNLVEIIIKPEDEEGYHWDVEYYIIKYDKGKFVRVVDSGI